MKKMLKENKGFSLVELLIALLIMAVIAGTAITLFGGVLNTSKAGADRETAEAIKRGILTYMNASNDMDLDWLGSVPDASGSVTKANAPKDAQDLVNKLAVKTVIPSNQASGELKGEYGPFLEKPNQKPAHPDTPYWDIDINTSTQVISVTSSSTTSSGLDGKLNIHN